MYRGTMDHRELASTDLNLLVAFDALLETCSVTKAAALLHVTQSAMSHTLKRLRDTFGDPLFVRSGRAMAPTPTAEALAIPVRAALVQFHEAMASGGRFDPLTTTRSFKIAASDFAALTLIPDILRLFRERAPNANIVVLQGTRTDTAALCSGDLDLALYPVQEQSPDLLSTQLFEERFVGLVRADHPDVGATLTLETYAELPHLLISPTGGGPARADSALAEHGLTRRVVVRVAHFLVAPLLVAESDLILTAPARLARFAVSVAPVRIVELPLTVPGFPVDAIWHVRHAAEPANRWIRELVVEAATHLVEEGQLIFG